MKNKMSTAIFVAAQHALRHFRISVRVSFGLSLLACLLIAGQLSTAKVGPAVTGFQSASVRDSAPDSFNPARVKLAPLSIADSTQRDDLGRSLLAFDQFLASFARDILSEVSSAFRRKDRHFLTPEAPAQASIFTNQLRLPVGIAVDTSDNVITLSDNVFSLLLSKFNANGQLLDQLQLGNIMSSEALGHLAIDPATGLIFNLGSNGIVSFIDVNARQARDLFSIRQLNADTRTIYDVSTGLTDALDGAVQPQLASYGDIALRRLSNNQMELFVTGISFGFPFVMRITLSADLQQLVAAKVIVASRGSGTASGGVARGVAINNQGIVLTTLPTGANGGTLDRAFAFAANFDLNGQGRPQVLLNNADIASNGVTTDAAGNFYIATGSRGASACGAGGSGAMVIVSASLSGSQCFPLGTALADSRDVAVNRNASIAYMTVNDVVVKIPLGNQQPPQQGSVVALTSGQPRQGAASAPTPPNTVSISPTQYSIEVPASATQLHIEFSGNQPAVIIGRYGQPPGVDAQGNLLFDFGGPEPAATTFTLTFSASSNPALRTGKAYLLVANFGPGALNFTITATLGNSPPPSPSPSPSPGTTDELFTDDSTAEQYAQGPGVIVVNRLTPTRYPATLQRVKIFLRRFSDLPDPSGAQIRLVAFTGPSGMSQPPTSPNFVFDRQMPIPAVSATGDFVEFQIQNGPTINSGQDLYLGYQLPTGASGVVVAGDANGPQRQRAFFSQNGGSTFGLLAFVNQQTGAQIPINLMIRASIASGSGTCSYSVTPEARPADASGGNGTIAVMTASGCSWTAVANNNWLQITSASSGSGNGQVTYTVQPNSSVNSRTGSLTIAGQTFTVNQAGASSGGPAALRADYQFQNTLTSSTAGAPALTNLGNNTFRSATVDGRTRTVLSFAENDGVVLSPMANLTANGDYSVVMLFALESVDGYRRILDFKNGTSDNGLYVLDGELALGKIELDLFRQATEKLEPPITGNAFVQLVLTRSTDRGLAVYLDGVEQFSGPDFGATLIEGARLRFFRDNDSGGLTDEASAGSVARIRIYAGALSESEVAALDRLPTGQTCTYSISPENRSAAANGGTNTVSVTAPNGCSWTATANDNWLSVTPTMGSGNGQVSYSVQPNTSPSSRSGTLTIAGQTFTVTQAGAAQSSPMIAVQPTSLDFQSVNVGATKDLTLTVRNTGNATLNVTAITSSNSRFSVTSGTSFNVAAGGQQTVTVPFSPTASGVQTGALTIASNASNGPTTTVQLRGEGAQPQPTCPAVNNINPTSGPIGTPIAVTGQNFTGVTQVKFGGGATATPIVNSATELRVSVPPGAQSGPLALVRPGCTDATSQQSFTITTANASTFVRVIGGSGAPGGTVVVPIELESSGNITAASFSLRFNTAILSNPQVAVATEATAAGATSLLQIRGQLNAGRLGLAIAFPPENPPKRFPSGKLRLVLVTFTIAANASGQTSVEFDNQPTSQSVLDADTNEVVASFTPGMVNIAQGYEADVAPRPQGNGQINLADWNLIGQFFSGAAQVEAGSEFQRADCAPKATRGNGILNLQDWVEAGNYYISGELVGADGPVNPTGPSAARPNTLAATAFSQDARGVRLVGSAFQRGAINELAVVLDARGGESGLSFTVAFDPRHLRFIEAVRGDGALNASLVVNSARLAEGQVGLALALLPGERLAIGSHTLVRLRFVAVAGHDVGQTQVRFGDELVERMLVGAQAEIASARFADAAIALHGRGVATVSAASFNSDGLAAGSIVASFGSDLAAETQAATAIPLPTELAGTTVLVRDESGVERLAPLFFVSPAQVNYLIPEATAPGWATITVTGSNGVVAVGSVRITPVAPSLFTANADGAGVAAAVALRIRGNGTTSYEPIFEWSYASQRFFPAPLDLGVDEGGDQVFLTFFGTGLRGRAPDVPVFVKIDGVEAEVTYAGPQGGYAGLDQVNVRVPRALAGRGLVEVALVVGEQTANVVTIDIR